jgi:hypothetical protein
MISKIDSCDEGALRRNPEFAQLVVRCKIATAADVQRRARSGTSDTARERQMTDRSTAPVLQDVNTRMLAGAAVLVGVGAALGLAGIGVGAAAFVVAARRWYERNDLTPARHAKLTWEQARAAAVAGSGAWKGVDRSRYVKSAAR